MNFIVANNNDIVTIQIPVKNNEPVVNGVNATGVEAQQTFPTGISIYGTPSLTQGSYNTGTKLWTIGTLEPQETAVLTIKVKVDDISLQPFTIKTEVTIVENETTILNNTRYDVITQGPCVDCDACDPCKFVEPTIVVSNDTAGLTFDLAANDVIKCTCCQKRFEVVGNPVNIYVNSISTNGILNYSYIDIDSPGSLVYRVRCENCTNGMDYMSSNATVTFNSMARNTYIYDINTPIEQDYEQEEEYEYFRFDTQTNDITFTLLPAADWVVGEEIVVYVFDSSTSGPMSNSFTVETDGVDVFTETGTTSYITITNNYTSFRIVYVGDNTFDII